MAKGQVRAGRFLPRPAPLAGGGQPLPMSSAGLVSVCARAPVSLPARPPVTSREGARPGDRSASWPLCKSPVSKEDGEGGLRRGNLGDTQVSPCPGLPHHLSLLPGVPTKRQSAAPHPTAPFPGPAARGLLLLSLFPPKPAGLAHHPLRVKASAHAAIVTCCDSNK